MRTPVFNAARNIVGFLDHDAYQRQRTCFQLPSYPPIDLPHPDKPTTVGPTIKKVTFEWAVYAASRGARDVHYCDVLIVDDEPALLHVRGFLYFAEVYGQRLDETGNKRFSA